MDPQQSVKTARLAGFWYLLLAVSGILGFMVFHPRIFIADDPQQTLNNLITLGSVSRMRLLLELVIIVSQALAAVWFYKLFSAIDKWAAAALGIWGTVNSAVITVSAIAMSSAISIANAASPTFQEKILGIQLLGEIIANAWSVGGLFFGLWLMPMGYIIVRSGRMPIWLGRILILGGLGYLLQTFIKSAGVQNAYIDMLVIPATAGELWMIGYLLFFGIRTSGNEEKP